MIEKFFTKPLTRTEIWLTATGSFIVALAVLNRWIVTPLGLMSYGRVWQNHVSYMDIGFARRCLWGTLLTLTGLNKIPANEYSNAFFIHGIGLLALTLGIAIHMHGNAKKLTTAHVFIVFFSPAFILHLAYSTGTVDYVLACLLFASGLYVRSFWILGLLAAAGALIHEAYLFFVPFLALNNVLLLSGGRCPGLRDLTWRMIPTFFPPALAMLTVKIFASPIPNKLQFETLMHHKLPIAAYQHRLWSGFFEIFSSIADNTQTPNRLAAIFLHHFTDIVIPLLYALILCTLICRSKSSISARFLPFYATSLLLPLSISVIASDHLRWICMSAQLCLLSMITLQSSGILSISPKRLIQLLPFSLVAPFGVDPRDPFPIHRFILEKLL